MPLESTNFPFVRMSPGRKEAHLAVNEKHKADLRALVLAMIVIAPGPTKRLAFKAFGVAFAQFWSYPMRLAASHEEAFEIAAALLAEGTPSSPRAS